LGQAVVVVEILHQTLNICVLLAAEEEVTAAAVLVVIELQLDWLLLLVQD
jgi:hypothetical protein